MFLFILIRSFVAAYVSASIYLYIFGFTGIGFFVTLLSTRTAAAIISPQKIGYSTTSLFLDSGKEGVSEIGFGEIVHLSVSNYPSGWYAEIETRDGEKEVVGPGISDGYGRDLINTYARFRSRGGNALSLREVKGIYPRTRLVAAPS